MSGLHSQRGLSGVSFATRVRTEISAISLEACWRSDEHAPVRDMNGIGHHDPHMPVDTGPAVPTAVRLRGVVHPHCEHVRSREVQAGVRSKRKLVYP